MAKKYKVCVDYINLDGTTERVIEHNYEDEGKANSMARKCREYYYPQKETFKIYIKTI